MSAERVVVGMSGGVDSSVAAALLKQQGYEVIGVSLRLLAQAVRPAPGVRCCLSGIAAAARVARHLGIAHRVIDVHHEFRREVIGYFCREYAHGRTPNPCTCCNERVKFAALLRCASQLKAGWCATGHYARIVRQRVRGAGPQARFRYALAKARDRSKDQSYFLYRLNQSQLRRCLFPLGDLSKSQVRQLARQGRIPVADAPDSQDICFLRGEDYRDYLRRVCSGAKASFLLPGEVVDTRGNLVGRHAGIPLYTIGQRSGLGIALGYPAHVTGFDLCRNRVIVGRRNEACARTCLVKDAVFSISPPKKKVALKVRIRYNHREAPADVLLSGKTVRVVFTVPQFAITPGQSAVFYRGDTVVGGGIIAAALH